MDYCVDIILTAAGFLAAAGRSASAQFEGQRRQRLAQFSLSIVFLGSVQYAQR